MIPLWAFVAVTIPLVLIPGSSTAVVLRNSVAGGTRAGLVTAVGINAGSFCYGLLSAFGFALVLQKWPAVWTVLRAGGALYLAGLAVQSFRHAARPPDMPAATGSSGPSGSAVQQIFEGFVTNALNPAIATFYLIVLPQFIPHEAPIVPSALLLTGVHISLAATWHVLWAVAGGVMAAALSAGRPRRILEVIAGCALLALAIKIAIAV